MPACCAPGSHSGPTRLPRSQPQEMENPLRACAKQGAFDDGPLDSQQSTLETETGFQQHTWILEGGEIWDIELLT